MKIVLASDNHGVKEPLDLILKQQYFADYYLHCGDCLLDEKDRHPFFVVSGNNDQGYRLPNMKVLELEGHRILLIHGHTYIFMNSLEPLVQKAEALDCDIVFFGHTHRYFDEVIRGIRFINPGSCLHNRDYTEPSYAVVEINGKDINVKRFNLDY